MAFGRCLSYYIKQLEMSEDFVNLPHMLTISTITMTCEFNTPINVMAVGKYMPLKHGEIVGVNYKTENVLRSLVKLKKKYNPRTTKKNFHNQVTVMVEIKNKRIINVKLFKNGAIQITGCKSLNNFTEAIMILCKNLKDYALMYDKTTRKITKLMFVNNVKDIGPLKVYKLKVRMINSNFHVGFLIDRVVLYRLSLENDITCTFDACLHACVNIKYNCDDDVVSIFVFETGSIIITGAKNIKHINRAYEFIVKYLYENYEIIVKENIDNFLKLPQIMRIVREMSREMSRVVY